MASAKRSVETAFGPEATIISVSRDAPHRPNLPEPFFFGLLKPSPGPPRPLPARGLARVPSELEVLEAELTRSNEDLVRKDVEIVELKQLLEDGYRRVASAEKDYLELVESLSALVQSGNSQDGLKLSELVRRHSAPKLNIDLRLRIDRTYNEIMDEYVKLPKPETCEFEYCERLDEAMSACIPDIARLSGMEGGLLKAFELLLYMGNKTYIETRGNNEIILRAKRMTDVPADDLLWTVLKSIKRSDLAFKVEKQFLDLQQRRKRLQVFEGDGHGGIAKKSLFIHGSSGRYPWSNKDTYFPKSYELMWSLTRSVEDVQKYAADVRKIIEVTYKTICEQVVSSGVKNAFECSSFKLSQAMIHFVQPIRRLAYMDGRISDAFNLALFLASKSNSDLPSIYGGYNYRVSDPLIDELLDEISRLVKNNDENFDPTETIATTKRQMDFLEQRGVYTYLPEAYAFLITGEDGEKRKRRLKKGLKGDHLVAFHAAENIRRKIGTLARNEGRKLDTMLAKNGSTSRDWLSFRMKDFVPEIEKLSQMDEGLTHALNLIILAGKHSFTAIPGIGPLYNGGHTPSKENAERGLRSDNEEIFERPSDPLLDDLLSKILYLVDETNSWGNFDITREKEALNAQRQFLAEYGIRTYFPKSYELLCRCE